MQRRVGDGHAADEDGLSRATGVIAPVRSDLHVDAEDDGGHLLGGKLVRDCPARLAGDEPERVLKRERIDLVDDAVDFERKAGSARRDRFVERDELLRTRATRQLGIDRNAECFERIEQAALRGRPRPSARFSNAIAKNCSGRRAVIAGSIWRTAPARCCEG